MRTSTPSPSRLALCMRREPLGEARQNARARLHQHDARGTRVEAPEVAREGATRDLRDGARELDAGGTTSDHDERRVRAPRVRRARQLGRLERAQDAPPHIERLTDRLETGRVRRPRVVTEVGVRHAGGDDQIVILRLAALEQHAATLDVDALDGRHPDGDVLLTPEQLSDRRRDVRGGQRRGSDLIEQRLEQVVVGAVDQRDADVGSPQRGRRCRRTHRRSPPRGVARSRPPPLRPARSWDPPRCRRLSRRLRALGRFPLLTTLTPSPPAATRTHVRAAHPRQDPAYLVVGEVREDLGHREVPLRRRQGRREELGGELGDRGLARFHHLADLRQPPQLVPRMGNGSAGAVAKRRAVAGQDDVGVEARPPAPATPGTSPSGRSRSRARRSPAATPPAADGRREHSSRSAALHRQTCPGEWPGVCTISHVRSPTVTRSPPSSSVLGRPIEGITGSQSHSPREVSVSSGP